MAKIRMTAKRKLRAKKYRQLQEINSLRNFKAISQIFVQFGADVEKDLTKVDLFTKIKWTELYKRLKKGIRNTMTLTMNNIAESSGLFMDIELDKKQISAVKNTAITEYNKTVDNRIRGIAETTKKQISLVVEEGQRLGLNKRTIARNINEKFIEISKGRAKTIARTETSKATSITTHEAATYGQMEYKIWMHVGAGSTDRPYHRDILSGQKIKIDEPFNVDGNDGMYPHDPNLPVGEIINCACICIYE
jgi:5'-3' exonuclease